MRIVSEAPVLHPTLNMRGELVTSLPCTVSSAHLEVSCRLRVGPAAGGLVQEVTEDVEEEKY